MEQRLRKARSVLMTPDHTVWFTRYRADNWGEVLVRQNLGDAQHRSVLSMLSDFTTETRVGLAAQSSERGVVAGTSAITRRSQRASGNFAIRASMMGRDRPGFDLYAGRSALSAMVMFSEGMARLEPDARQCFTAQGRLVTFEAPTIYGASIPDVEKAEFAATQVLAFAEGHPASEFFDLPPKGIRQAIYERAIRAVDGDPDTIIFNDDPANLLVRAQQDESLAIAKIGIRASTELTF